MVTQNTVTFPSVQVLLNPSGNNKHMKNYMLQECNDPGLQDDTLMNLAMALVSSRKVLAPLDAAAKGAITPSMCMWRTDCRMPAFTTPASCDRTCAHAEGYHVGILYNLLELRNIVFTNTMQHMIWACSVLQALITGSASKAILRKQERPPWGIKRVPAQQHCAQLLQDCSTWRQRRPARWQAP